MLPNDDGTKPTLLGPETGHGRLLAFWEGGGASYVLRPGGVVRIGRAAPCELRIDDASVSRLHAEVRADGPVKIKDLGSSNGVRVRGVRLAPQEEAVVGRGDVVEIGTVTLLIEPPPPAPLAVGVRSTGAMDAVDRLVGLVAKSDLSVLILGETGVGKTVTAAAIHDRSPRAGRPFVAINCAALPEQLLEAELFGYEKGAFTGASEGKAGLLEVGAGGTVFLDEIAEASPATQAKLLTCVEARTVQRLGSVRPRAVDVRFVTATNADLPARVAARTFREDLYFRLNGVTVTVPPLRDRRGEIAELAATFLAAASARLHQPVPAFGADVAAWLASYAFPGNVRELKALMERALVLAVDGVVRLEHLGLPAGAAAPSEPGPGPPGPVDAGVESGRLRDEIDQLERRRIEEALAKCNGNQTRAAVLLGMSRRALIGRMDTYRLPRPRKG